MSPEFYLAGAVTATSVIAYVVMRRIPGCSARSLRVAIQMTVESVGLGLLFVVANVLVEMGIVFVMRKLTGRFVSLYLAGDLTILPISFLQGLVVSWWSHVSDRGPRDR